MIARQLAASFANDVKIVSDSDVASLLDEAAREVGSGINLGFLHDEWRLIVDAWNVRDGDRYRDLPRLGRKVRMAASRRDDLWAIFSAVRQSLYSRGFETEAGLMHQVAQNLVDRPFTHVVVDEAQDISVP